MEQMHWKQGYSCFYNAYLNRKLKNTVKACISTTKVFESTFSDFLFKLTQFYKFHSSKDKCDMFVLLVWTSE